MSTWAVSMFKDEEDVAYHNIIHMAGQVDGIIVANNMSTDRTERLLYQAKAISHIPIIITRDTEPGYWQSQKMSALAQQARNLGATWIVPFDADELWAAPEGTIKEWLSRRPEHIELIVASLYNYWPSSIDDASIRNPFKRIQYREPAPSPLPKVAFKVHEDSVIATGNHWVCPAGPSAEGLVVRHYPVRNYFQFASKMRNGKRALDATDLSPDTGAHWRAYGRVLEEGGEAAMRLEYADRVVRDPSVLTYDPS